MINGIYCVRDERVGFMSPTMDTNDQTATRNFEFALSRAESIMHTHKGDFSLFRLGTFNTETGEIVLESIPKIIVRGNDYAESK